jgi:hypothetical protein
MARLVSPHDSDLRKTARDVEWTVVAPLEDVELENDEMSELEDVVYRTKDGTGERDPVFQMVETRSGEEIRNLRVDITLLRKILYEHRRYALAQGFSDPEMDVLRSIEFHTETRVGLDEIMEDSHSEDYSESTIYKALRSLREKDLVSKVRPGVYRYSGP